MLPVHGECRYSCPTGYEETEAHIDEHNNVIEPRICKPCNGTCHRFCSGRDITYLQDTYYLRGCTILEGSLRMKLNVNFFDLHKQLERNLGDIQEIHGTLHIHR